MGRSRQISKSNLALSENLFRDTGVPTSPERPRRRLARFFLTLFLGDDEGDITISLQSAIAHLDALANRWVQIHMRPAERLLTPNGRFGFP